MADAQIQGLLILLVIAAWHYFSTLETQVSVGGALFSAGSGILVLQRHPNSSTDLVLNASLGRDFELHVETKRCDASGMDSVCLEWLEEAMVKLDYIAHENVDCYTITWETDTRDADPHDCFDLSMDHWYGGAHLLDDRWSFESRPIGMISYLSADTAYNDFEHQNAYGSVLERYWLSASGVAIFVNDDVPLHVGINSTRLCLKASYGESDSYYEHNASSLPELKYEICVGRNVRHIHEFMAKRHWKRPVGIPDEAMLKHPIWSTAAKYNTEINQTKVLQFAYEIHNHGFKGSQLHIDDMYTPKYGDFVFDSVNFPDPKNMTNVLHELGFRVTASVVPFANIDSQAFQEGAKHGYFVNDRMGKVPVLAHWWNGVGAIIDPTHPQAIEWFEGRLRSLRDAGVDSFSFEAGEVNFLQNGFKTHQPLLHANHFSRVYAEMAANITDRMMTVRVGYKSQQLPVMVRVMRKESRWGYDRAFNSIIPSCLLFGIIGYPFILPDAIGGSAPSSELPDKELYIRWLQLSAFLPAMHFSIAPWQYDQETILIAKSFIKLHTEYVHRHVMVAAEEATITGAPIIRPLWWHDPEDPKTFSIRSEFLVGRDLLVAPITNPHARSRTIYLPRGQWRDALSNDIITGPSLLEDFEVNLNETAYFELVNSY